MKKKAYEYALPHVVRRAYLLIFLLKQPISDNDDNITHICLPSNPLAPDWFAIHPKAEPHVYLLIFHMKDNSLSFPSQPALPRSLYPPTVVL